MKNIFDTTSFNCSKLITDAYSTSFSIGTMLLHKRIRPYIHAIYGFVRYADEIVDSFHGYDKKYLLEKFCNDTYEAIEQGISLNPILNSFQHAVNKYNIKNNEIAAFLSSMKIDLLETKHDSSSYKAYIYGSAEVVGLMCLRVFVEGNEQKFEELKMEALALGSAFQKVNFLRDLNYDSIELGRSYFPEMEFNSFDESVKQQIEEDIQKDFSVAYEGILKLPASAKLGVYVAYIYYYNLFQKIKNTKPAEIMSSRVRIPNSQKIVLLTQSYFKHSFSLV